MICFRTADGMDLEKPGISDSLKGCVSASCSICLEVVLDPGERSVAKLQCGHEFHLDCIGSAFNAKGAMQCPNCRKVEKGHWLYAHGHHLATDFDIDGWITEDIYDLNYFDLPLGYPWCPYSISQLASLFEEEPQPNSYHEPLGSSAFGDRLSSSGRAHVCPYLTLNGFPHPMHTASSSSSDHSPENSYFQRQSAALAGQPQAEMLNPRSFSPAQPQNHNWPQYSMPPAAISDLQYSLRLPRADINNHLQRPGSYVHPHPLPQRYVRPRSATNLVAGATELPVLGEVRPHGSRSTAFAPIRSRSRGLGPIPISTSTSTDTGGFYGFSVPTSTTRSLQDTGEGQFDRVYGWGRENFAPLPWIPVDGESRWWGPFNPNQAPSGSFHRRGGSTADERVSQSRSENGYHQRVQPPPASRMPPYM